MIKKIVHYINLKHIHTDPKLSLNNSVRPCVSVDDFFIFKSLAGYLLNFKILTSLLTKINEEIFLGIHMFEPHTVTAYKFAHNGITNIENDNSVIFAVNIGSIFNSCSFLILVGNNCSRVFLSQ